MASPAQQYVIKYNGYQLPGYAQEEEDDSVESITTHYGPYWDGGITDYMGLSNKQMVLKFKIWEPCGTYTDLKNKYMEATAILRSSRSDWAKLYIDYQDRYYKAKVKSIRRSKAAGTSVRTLEYDVEFEALPWMESEFTHSLVLTSAGSVDTTGIRTIASGAWSPVIVTITGSNVTVSGYTETGAYAGYISVSGTATSLVVDTEAFTATEGATNANSKMDWKNYGLWVGPGNTTFVVGGTVTNVDLSWRDRWY